MGEPNIRGWKKWENDIILPQLEILMNETYKVQAT